MITKRKIINFGFTSSILAVLLLIVLVLASTASAGNHAKKQAGNVDTVILPTSWSLLSLPPAHRPNNCCECCCRCRTTRIFYGLPGTGLFNVLLHFCYGRSPCGALDPVNCVWDAKCSPWLFLVTWFCLFKTFKLKGINSRRRILWGCNNGQIFYRSRNLGGCVSVSSKGYLPRGYSWVFVNPVGRVSVTAGSWIIAISARFAMELVIWLSKARPATTFHVVPVKGMAGSKTVITSAVPVEA